MRYILFLVVLALMNTGCGKGTGCGDRQMVYSPEHPYVPPFAIQISDSAHDDLFSQKYLGAFPRDSVKLYYKDSKGIAYYDSVTIYPANKSDSVYYVDVPMALNQSLSGIHTFYFKRGFNIVDTIFFDERIYDKCQDRKLYAFKYNGMDIIKTDESVVLPH